MYSEADRGADLARLQSIHDNHKEKLNKLEVALVCLSIAMNGRHCLSRPQIAGNIIICLQICQDGLPDISEEDKNNMITQAMGILSDMPDAAETNASAIVTAGASGATGGDSLLNSRAGSGPGQRYMPGNSGSGSARANVNLDMTSGLESRPTRTHGNNRRNTGSGAVRRNARQGSGNAHPPRTSSQPSTHSAIVYTSNYEPVPAAGYRSYHHYTEAIDTTTFQTTSISDNGNQDGDDEEKEQSTYGDDPDDQSR